MEMSEEMKKYFQQITDKSNKEYTIAKKAREKGYDPTEEVEIYLAKNMAERVVGLISVVAPKIVETDVVKRIIELEKKWGVLDWRVALQIAYEVAQQKFCKFKDEQEAIEIGIRIGFAYGTVGVVSSPIEGLINLEIKKRLDYSKQNNEDQNDNVLDKKQTYFCLNYGGPIRNAGGTAAALSVLIADYVRKKLGFGEYDPTEKEINRARTELEDYHEKITNLQYFPSREETRYLIKKIPIEISGDGSEKKEVTNYKDLPRISTNRIRSGFCLMHSSCIPLKAEKLWKQISKWGEEMDMQHWNFLEEFIEIKKEAHSNNDNKKNKVDDSKNENKTGNNSFVWNLMEQLKPDYTYIKDLVAGRPVISHPLANGALRLRYGRSRISGFSAQSIHPATMQVMNKFIATGTQLKTERPGKGAVYTPCTTIDGPIVKLKNGSVKRINTENEAKEINDQIQEILYLGDVLINYGDFLNRNHKLIPCGYVEEWWIQELEKAIVETFGNLDYSKLAEIIKEDSDYIEKILKNFMTKKPIAKVALKISKEMKIPLHPKFTYYWNSIKREELEDVVNYFLSMKIEDGKGILENKPKEKRLIEIIGIPHEVIQNEIIVIDKDETIIIQEIFKEMYENFEENQEGIKLFKQKIEKKQYSTNVDVINSISKYEQRDKCGTFIGARMGRPEKAKMRRLTGSPHGIFPVGEEGGKFRSIQSAIENGTVKGEFSLFKCPSCENETIFSRCEKCDTKTVRLYNCKTCGKQESTHCDKVEDHGPNALCFRTEINIKEIFEDVLKKLKIKSYPEMIKGVRGTTNKEHIPEHLIKAILRAKHNIYVNKDGTIRYDASELPITHFKPKEIDISIEQLKELGYITDYKGRKLENKNQIIEIKPQDIIIPCCDESPDEKADEVFFRVTQFIDELLVKLYGQKAYYKLKDKKELVGQLVIALAPHTSAGTLGRIIGFSKTQGLIAHPLMHAAMRRDCDGDEAAIILLMDGFLNFSKKYLPQSRGSTMDAPLVLTSIIIPAEVDDMIFDIERVPMYPIEFYKACQFHKNVNSVQIETIKDVLNKPEQYEGLNFTHDTENLNQGVLCSAYKTLPSMQDKLISQMKLAEKIRAVDESDVARLVIEKHFIRDIKGNLRKFSMQEFRCTSCNTKYRRPPLLGRCTECNGKIIFTISPGSIVKYLQPSLSLAHKYDLPVYVQQTLELTKRRIEGVFGKNPEKQEGLGSWFD